MKDITEEPQTFLQFIKSPEFRNDIIIGLVVTGISAAAVKIVREIFSVKRKLQRVKKALDRGDVKRAR